MALMNLVIFFAGLFAGGQGTCKVSQYTISKDFARVFASVSDGDYMVQLITTITDEGNCRSPSRESLQAVYAFKYAIKSINENKTLLPGLKLGYRIDDDCNMLQLVVKRSLDIVSHYRSNSVCRAEFGACDVQATPKKVLGVIGTDRSSSSIPLAGLLGLFKIPQISFGASSRTLSNAEAYPSFFRTIPSDSNQAQAMIDVLSHFGWSYVVAVGSDDDYGKLGIAELKARSIEKEICIAREEYLPLQEDALPQAVSRTVETLLTYPRARVVIFFGFPVGQGDMFLREAEKQGLRKIWLVSEAWNPAAELIDAPLGQLQSIIAISISAKYNPSLGEHILQELEEDLRCDQWMRMFLEVYFNCNATGLFNESIIGISTSCQSNPCKECQVKVKDLADAIAKPPSYIANNLIDAVFALAHGLASARDEMCAANETCRAAQTPSAIGIADALQRIQFQGNQGDLIHFDNNGDPAFARYSVSNLQVVDAKPRFFDVGSWVKGEIDSATLKLDEEKIVWPFWASGAPESKCAVECPPGTFVVGKVGCCWGCEECPEHSVSNRTMAESCDLCPPPRQFYANQEKTECLPYRVTYIKPNTASGILILLCSSIGIAICLVSFVLFCRYRQRDAVAKSNPSLGFLILIIICISFVYAPLYLLEPSGVLCQARTYTFLLIWNLLASLLWLKTRAVGNRLKISNYVGLAVQTLLLLVLTIPEVISMAVWTYVDSQDLLVELGHAEGELWLACPLNLTPAKITSLAIPCILLFTATFCLAHESNHYHPFNEPKFLSFNATALCVTIGVYLPTYKYVVGLYKSLLGALVSHVILFLSLICLIAPTLYAAMMGKNMAETQHQRNSLPRALSSATLATIVSETSVNEVPNERQGGNDMSEI